MHKWTSPRADWAEGEALAIQLVNEAADRYFTGNAQLLCRLMTVERALQNNSKVVVPTRSGGYRVRGVRLV